MTKTLHKTLAIFILVGSSLLGLSNSTAQTGTLEASPELVTEFTNANGTGNTALSWTSFGSQRTLITLEKQKGNKILKEIIVVNNFHAKHSNFPIKYIQDGWTFRFRLYSGDADSSILGILLDEVVVQGGAVAVDKNKKQ
jgi:hypothetical protein